MSARCGRFSAQNPPAFISKYGLPLADRDGQANMSKSDIVEYALGRRTLAATATKPTPPPAWLRLPSESRSSPFSNSPAAILAHRPDDVGISASDWSALLASDANAVVVGADPAIVRLLTAVWSTLRKPVCWVESGRLWLPPQLAGTLVLRNVNDLVRQDQVRLLDWLGQDGRSIRVLASTPRPLFPDVEAGAFLDRLYYRLNTLHVPLKPSH
jgi:Sigma-54 interaction domain